jgi:hypothetical protein
MSGIILNDTNIVVICVMYVNVSRLIIVRFYFLIYSHLFLLQELSSHPPRPSLREAAQGNQ